MVLVITVVQIVLLIDCYFYVFNPFPSFSTCPDPFLHNSSNHVTCQRQTPLKINRTRSHIYWLNVEALANRHLKWWWKKTPSVPLLKTSGGQWGEVGGETGWGMSAGFDVKQSKQAWEHLECFPFYSHSNLEKGLDSNGNLMFLFFIYIVYPPSPWKRN